MRLYDPVNCAQQSADGRPGSNSQRRGEKGAADGCAGKRGRYRMGGSASWGVAMGTADKRYRMSNRLFFTLLGICLVGILFFLLKMLGTELRYYF